MKMSSMKNFKLIDNLVVHQLDVNSLKAIVDRVSKSNHEVYFLINQSALDNSHTVEIYEGKPLTDECNEESYEEF